MTCVFRNKIHQSRTNQTVQRLRRPHDRNALSASKILGNLTCKILRLLRDIAYFLICFSDANEDLFALNVWAQTVQFFFLIYKKRYFFPPSKLDSHQSIQIYTCTSRVQRIFSTGSGDVARSVASSRGLGDDPPPSWYVYTFTENGLPLIFGLRMPLFSRLTVLYSQLAHDALGLEIRLRLSTHTLIFPFIHLEAYCKLFLTSSNTHTLLAHLCI